MEIKDWLTEGNDWFKKGNFLKAIECYDKAIKLKPDFADAYYNKGFALSNLGEYEKAIECFDKVIELKPDFADACGSKGNRLYNLGKYEEAIACFDKAIELKPDFADTYNNKGLTLYNLGKYNEAIECFDKVIKLKPDFAEAYFNKGNTLDILGKYEEAIACFDKAIELKPDFATAYHNKGNRLYNLGKYEEAIKYYDQAIALKPDLSVAYNNKGLMLINLRKYNEAARCFSVAKSDIFDVFTENEETARYMLDDDKFFKEATQNADKAKIEDYKNIYLCSLKILTDLQVKGEESETNVAHYTKKDKSEILLFDKKPFRLTSVSTANDTQEGKTLFDYLFDNRETRPQSEEFGAFVGCFMFNHDNLNQFRLYGKENNVEGTGISIVMRRDFFSISNKMPFQPTDTQRTLSFKEDNKEPLFRCIYIDPETSQIVSVGHRDFHTFYKTKEILYNNHDKEKRIKEKTEEIENYKKNIDKIEKKVVENLTALKGTIQKKHLEPGIIYNLLLNLRYLVKHVAFKEEQECRIIKIKRLCEADNSIIDEGQKHERLYINYLSLQYRVEKIYFGPKALGMELFQNLLAYHGFKNVTCYRSTSPLA